MRIHLGTFPNLPSSFLPGSLPTFLSDLKESTSLPPKISPCALSPCFIFFTTTVTGCLQLLVYLYSLKIFIFYCTWPCYTGAFSRCREQGLLSICSTQASFCGGFSWGRAQQLLSSGLPAPMHVGHSQIRNATGVSCTGRWILNHWMSHQGSPESDTFIVSEIKIQKGIDFSCSFSIPTKFNLDLAYCSRLLNIHDSKQMPLLFTISPSNFHFLPYPSDLPCSLRFPIRAFPLTFLPPPFLQRSLGFSALPSFCLYSSLTK